MTAINTPGFMDQAECLYDHQTVCASIEVLAASLNHDFADKQPVVLVVMTGGAIVAGHLLPQLSFPLELDYIHATRYQGKMTGEKVRWLVQPQISLIGRDVLIIDDIHDVGLTLGEINSYCMERGATSVTSAVLLLKNHPRKASVPCDYHALEVDDRFVFGFGMDYKGLWRNAPGIFALPKA
ncbi:hypoxanthine-guanine phosphoribosyltransferase [Umboniibacter marinipuniceus]|uniref:Hypoxanthine phosphoribosyltransferase n=1 Tax=Umboniibacter marinipuniceus TaxID=569599 RepID=A0A3M0AEG1_9GAMM|nr:hypoxanthine-guanine phosphoribosyltransferase [Umboniibacter marinipuniceus]RMA81148.1 hypoxanthine phosphoribosyltransferase [Umboniibacter marinipuniceus]